MLNNVNAFMNNNLLTIRLCATLVCCFVPLCISIINYIDNYIDNVNSNILRWLRIGLLTVSIICFCIVAVTTIYQRLPGYVQKPYDATVYIDNNGIFGTGHGGVARPTKYSLPVTHIDSETGKKKTVADYGPGEPWAGPKD